jgi:2-haloalkanoic acid dehalogenase type II
VTERPRLFTFDIFGTVIDWRTGLLGAIRAKGGKAGDVEFQALIDHQAEAEHGPYRPYAEIVAQSLVNVLGMSRARARSIGDGAGEWPLFPDARDGIRRLQRIAPCVAMTNSDAHQGIAVQRQLGFRLSGWICAEEVRRYKPDVAFWLAARARSGVSFGPGWRHVSAYADYDLETASRLGLSVVFVERPHSVPALARDRVRDLRELAGREELRSEEIPTSEL